MLSISFALVFIIIALYFIKNVTKPQNYPPGPKWYPVVGSSHVLEKMMKKFGSQWGALVELAKEYSTEVIGLKLGSELLVVVYGDKNIRQVFLDKEFEGRPDTFFVRLRCLGKRMGITFADGPLWKEHRQFAVKQLKNVGFGKTLMEKEIQKEMMNIVAYIKRNNNQHIHPKKMLASAVMNTLWKFAAGERIKEDRLKYLLDLLNARSKAFSMAGGWLNQAPWCRFLFPELSGYALLKKMNQQLSAIIDEAIQKHKRKKVDGNDFIYCFLEEIERSKESFSDEQLRTVCLDLLIAGSQTTSNVVEFALLSVLRDQVLQQRIFEEVHNTIGDNTPSWTDSYRLVYTSAFILEVQRFYSIVPLAGPRRVLEDTKIDGYTIPKGTTILISLRDLYFNEKLWKNPYEFMPERFIGSNGELKSPDHLYPFGLGRRRCPGDSLAKSFIFIVFVGIIQKYKILPINGILPSNEPMIGLISAPKPFSVDFVPRC